MTYQAPAAVPAGIVSAVDATLVAPAASSGTARVPSGTSLASSTLLAERWKAVVEPAAGLPPPFFVVSLTVIVPPAAAVAGTVNGETVRSGPIWTARAATLLVSSVSSSALAASARARTYQ